MHNIYLRVVLLSFNFKLRRVHGAPLDRRRVYIVLIRDDVLTDEIKQRLEEEPDIFSVLVAERIMGMRMHCKVHWTLGLQLVKTVLNKP